MHRPTGPGPTGRLLVLLLSVALLTGLTAQVTSATSATGVAGLPACQVADTLTLHRSLTDWRRALLDQQFRLSSAYKPKDLRSTAGAGLNAGYKVRRVALTDLKKMATAARRARARFSVQSAYRSYATQKATFASWVRAHGMAVALKESARAGHSEHQLGTTLDLRSYRGRAPWDVKDWATSKAGKWLKANAWKYGFVMSYPKGKTAVTCYTYEPWHYRYVGRTLARQVRDSKLTLREFLWQRQNPPAGPEPTPTPTPEPTPTPTPTPTPEPTPSDPTV
jgi:zinc D-Ala-D-Ala carboxypeptidase